MRWLPNLFTSNVGSEVMKLVDFQPSIGYILAVFRTTKTIFLLHRPKSNIMVKNWKDTVLFSDFNVFLEGN